MKKKREEIRKRILDSALGEFLEKGFEDATTRGLAGAAGVSYGNMYKYFSGKEDILDGVMGTYAASNHRRFLEVLEHRHGEGAVDFGAEGIIAGFVSMFRESRSRFIVFFTKMRGARLDRYREGMVAIMRGHMEEVIGNELLADVFTSNLVSSVMRFAREYVDADAFEGAVRLYLRYHFAGVRGIR